MVAVRGGELGAVWVDIADNPAPPAKKSLLLSFSSFSPSSHSKILSQQAHFHSTFLSDRPHFQQSSSPPALFSRISGLLACDGDTEPSQILFCPFALLQSIFSSLAFPIDTGGSHARFSIPFTFL